jgi:hypothetical protein
MKTCSTTKDLAASLPNDVAFFTSNGPLVRVRPILRITIRIEVGQVQHREVEAVIETRNRGKKVTELRDPRSLGKYLTTSGSMLRLTIIAKFKQQCLLLVTLQQFQPVIVTLLL